MELIQRLNFTTSNLEPITNEEIVLELNNLRKRAVGVDGLNSATLKSASHSEAVVCKLRITCQQWLDNGQIPEYLKQAKVIPLSKETTMFPQVGNIRTIAVLPAITKVYEKLILTRLQEEITAKKLIHDSQSGFQRGKSTLSNLNSIIMMIELAKNKASD